MDPILIRDEPIDIKDLIENMEKDSCCGAFVSFLGIVRHGEGNEQTQGLFYECYLPMVQKELEEIVKESKQKWPVRQIGVAHRMGYVPAGQTSLVVIVSSPHRQESFSAIQFLIDQIKKRVPIWKKEVLDEGNSRWVGS